MNADGFAMPGTENGWFGITCNVGNTTVEGISFDYNYYLSGSIPPELGNLYNLERLRINSNQLTGSIPPELGNLSNLQDLDLYRNQLTGRKVVFYAMVLCVFMIISEWDKPRTMETILNI